MCTCEMHVKWLLKYGNKDVEYNVSKGLLMYDKHITGLDNLQICNKHYYYEFVTINVYWFLSYNYTSTHIICG